MSYDLAIQVIFEFNGEAYYPKIVVDESIPELLVSLTLLNLIARNRSLTQIRK